MKLPLVLKCIIYLLVAGIVAAHAATYYVDPQGTDGGSSDGSEIRPWKTINYAIGRSFPGSIIILKAGATFTEKVTIAATDGGSPGLPLTIRSDAINPAVIAPPTVNDNAFSIYNAGYVHLENLRFTGQGMDLHQTDGASLYCDDAGHDSISIINCEFSGFGKQGLVIGGWNGASGGFRHVRVDRCIFRDNRRGGASTYAADPAANQDFVFSNCRAYNNLGDPTYTASHSGSGIVLGSVTGGRIEYCVAYNNGARCSTTGGPVGIWAYDATNITIQFCEAYNNHAINCDGGGFDLDGGCQNCLIQYCYSHDNDGAGYLICQYTGARAYTNNVVRYNISQNDGRRNGFAGLHFYSAGSNGGIQNTLIYGNTVYNAFSYAVRFQNTSGQTGTKLWNNIFMAGNGKTVVGGNPSTAVAKFEHNLYWCVGGGLSLAGQSTLSAWQNATGQEKINGALTGLYADPLLTNAGGGGTLNDPASLANLSAYRLLTGSPCINSGITLAVSGGRDFYGANIPLGGAFDIGACEWQGNTQIRTAAAPCFLASPARPAPDVFDVSGRRYSQLVHKSRAGNCVALVSRNNKGISMTDFVSGHH